MLVRFDSESDAIYVSFREVDPGASQRTDRVSQWTIVDYDADGEPLGVELLFVSQGLDLTGVPHRSEIAEALRRIPHPQPAA